MLDNASSRFRLGTAFVRTSIGHLRTHTLPHRWLHCRDRPLPAQHDAVETATTTSDCVVHGQDPVPPMSHDGTTWSRNGVPQRGRRPHHRPALKLDPTQGRDGFIGLTLGETRPFRPVSASRSAEPPAVPSAANPALGRWASPFGLNPTCSLRVAVSGLVLRLVSPPGSDTCLRFAPARRLPVSRYCRHSPLQASSARVLWLTRADHRQPPQLRHIAHATFSTTVVGAASINNVHR